MQVPSGVIEWLESEMEAAYDRMEEAFAKLQTARAEEEIARDRHWHLATKIAWAEQKAGGDTVCGQGANGSGA